jgi:hypothetical protein
MGRGPGVPRPLDHLYLLRRQAADRSP